MLGLVRKFDFSRKDEPLVGKVALILVMIVRRVVGGRIIVDGTAVNGFWSEYDL